MGHSLNILGLRSGISYKWKIFFISSHLINYYIDHTIYFYFIYKYVVYLFRYKYYKILYKFGILYSHLLLDITTVLNLNIYIYNNYWFFFKKSFLEELGIRMKKFIPKKYKKINKINRKKKKRYWFYSNLLCKNIYFLKFYRPPKKRKISLLYLFSVKKRLYQSFFYKRKKKLLNKLAFLGNKLKNKMFNSDKNILYYIRNIYKYYLKINEKYNEFDKRLKKRKQRIKNLKKIRKKNQKNFKTKAKLGKKKHYILNKTLNKKIVKIRLKNKKKVIQKLKIIIQKKKMRNKIKKLKNRIRVWKIIRKLNDGYLINKLFLKKKINLSKIENQIKKKKRLKIKTMSYFIKKIFLVYKKKQIKINVIFLSFLIYLYYKKNKKNYKKIINKILKANKDIKVMFKITNFYSFYILLYIIILIGTLQMKLQIIYLLFKNFYKYIKLKIKYFVIRKIFNYLSLDFYQLIRKKIIYQLKYLYKVKKKKIKLKIIPVKKAYFSPDLILTYWRWKLKKKFTINSLFYPYARKYLLKNNYLSGFAFKRYGRFDRRQRASVKKETYGKIGYSTYNKAVTYFFSTIITKYGLCSIRFWYNINKKNLNKRFNKNFLKVKIL